MGALTREKRFWASYLLGRADECRRSLCMGIRRRFSPSSRTGAYNRAAPDKRREESQSNLLLFLRGNVTRRMLRCCVMAEMIEIKIPDDGDRSVCAEFNRLFFIKHFTNDLNHIFMFLFLGVPEQNKCQTHVKRFQLIRWQYWWLILLKSWLYCLGEDWEAEIEYLKKPINAEWNVLYSSKCL